MGVETPHDNPFANLQEEEEGGIESLPVNPCLNPAAGASPTNIDRINSGGSFNSSHGYIMNRATTPRAVSAISPISMYLQEMEDENSRLEEEYSRLRASNDRERDEDEFRHRGEQIAMIWDMGDQNMISEEEVSALQEELEREAAAGVDLALAYSAPNRDMRFATSQEDINNNYRQTSDRITWVPQQPRDWAREFAFDANISTSLAQNNVWLSNVLLNKNFTFSKVQSCSKRSSVCFMFLEESFVDILDSFFAIFNYSILF